MNKRRDRQEEALFDLQVEQGGDRAIKPDNRQKYHIDWPPYDKYRPKRSTAKLKTLGLLQYGPQDRSAQKNVLFIVEALREVHHATIVLPEFFLGSYSAYEADISSRASLAATIRPLQELSTRNQINLVGSLPVHKGEYDANNVVIVENGTTRFSIQDKGQLFGKEESDFTQGAYRRKISVGGQPASIQICMDIVDPVPVRKAVADGARVVLGPSTVSVDFLRTIHKARALENQVVSVFCNRTGKELDGTQYMGRSALFFPDGAELSAPTAQDQLLTATVDMDYVVGYIEKFNPSLS